MAHKHAAIKHIRQTKKRTLVNENVKREIEYLKKSILKKIASKDQAGALQLLTAYTQKLDKASKNNILKKNTVSRKKSRVTKRINALEKKS